jgi:hypothetical protein
MHHMGKALYLVILTFGLFASTLSLASLPPAIDGEPLPSLAPVLERLLLRGQYLYPDAGTYSESIAG